MVLPLKFFLKYHVTAVERNFQVLSPNMKYCQSLVAGLKGTWEIHNSWLTWYTTYTTDSIPYKAELGVAKRLLSLFQLD